MYAKFVGGNCNWIVDAEFFRKFLDGVTIVIVPHESENVESVFVFILELDEFGNFGAARSAPGGPEIKKDDFAFGAGERNGLSIETGETEVRRGIGVADEADGGLLVLRSRKNRRE